ncbi:MAG: hypothetical protein AAB410_03615 [Patescibacteria group bacterium]
MSNGVNWIKNHWLMLIGCLLPIVVLLALTKKWSIAIFGSLCLVMHLFMSKHGHKD